MFDPTVPANAGGVDVQPFEATRVTLHNYSATRNFTLLAHPERWDVFLTPEGPQVLPVLKQLSHQPGVAGVEQVRMADGRVLGDPGKAKAQKMREAFVVIPESIRVTAFGEDCRGYVHRYEGVAGPIHLLRWTRLYKVGASTHKKRDEPGYFAFLRKVRDELLGEPDAAVSEGLRVSLQVLRDRVRAAKGTPASARNLEVLEQKLQAFSRNVPEEAPGGSSVEQPEQPERPRRSRRAQGDA